MTEAGIAKEVGGDQECVVLQGLGKTVVKAWVLCPVWMISVFVVTKSL